MTAPPLPPSPVLRCALDYVEADGAVAGSRFYLSYTGGSASAADLNTLAVDIGTAWNSNLAVLVQQEYTLNEVDVLDITTPTGSSGRAVVSHPGGDASSSTPQQVAVNVAFSIARRYRGGKPRMYLPPPGRAAFAGENRWSTTYVGQANTQFAAFFAALAALSVGSLGSLKHVNVSYYAGFSNITNSSGRIHAAPTYRHTPLIDVVTGYKTSAVMSSQRRRRLATTP